MDEKMKNEPWLSVDQISRHLGVSKDTVYDWLKTRNMPGHRVGKLWKFQVSEVTDWIKSGGADALKNTRATKK